MRVIEIVGTNYTGSFRRTRTACRAIVLKDDRMLISYAADIGVMLIPGGGLEQDESEEHCVVREVAEETGYIIKPTECRLEIVEYYEDRKWTSRYYLGTIAGEGVLRLTDWEKSINLKPMWFPVEDVLSYYAEGIEKTEDEMRRGFFVREYSAIREILGEI